MRKWKALTNKFIIYLFPLHLGNKLQKQIKNGRYNTMMTNHASEQMFSLTFQQIDWKKFNKILKISSNSIIDLKDSE